MALHISHGIYLPAANKPKNAANGSMKFCWYPTCKIIGRGKEEDHKYITLNASNIQIKDRLNFWHRNSSTDNNGKAISRVPHAENPSLFVKHSIIMQS